MKQVFKTTSKTAKAVALRLPSFRAPLLSSLVPFIAVTMLMMLMAPLRGHAQAFVNGSITGTVEDPSSAVVPGVTVTLTNIGTHEKFSTLSDASGMYRFPNLPPGRYRLEGQMAHFKTYVQEPIEVQVNNALAIDIHLLTGTVHEEVVVNGQTPLIQPQSSSLGEVVGERATNELPLNGRNPIALVALSPGVVTQNQFGQNTVTVNSFASGNFQINGGVANQNAGYWDGAPMNASGYINELAILPTQDALQEFKVMTNNLPAQYDRFAGGIVSFVTKSGSNNFHGAVYEFIRNRVLNSNDYFSKQYHLPTPQFTQNQFGGNLGGPVVFPHLYNGKDKTFFFFSYDGFRLRQGASIRDTVPTADMRAGNFSATTDYHPTIYDPDTTTMTGPGTYTRQQFSQNKIPQNRIDSAAKVIANLWGLPNVPVPAGTIANNWFGHVSTGGNVDEYIGRVDQNISDKQHAFVRYAIVNQDNGGVDPFGTHFYAGGYPPTRIKNQQAVIDDAYSINPTTLLDLEVAYLRTALKQTPGSEGYDLSQFQGGWPVLGAGLTRRTLPDIQVADVSSTGGNGSIINTFTDDFDFLPNITLVRGNHDIKIGADLRLSRLDYGQIDVAAGVYAFNGDYTSAAPFSGNGGSGFASFLLGDAAAGLIQKNNFVAAQQIYRAFYVQDNWKVTRKLTINAGLRYSIDGAFSERHNRLSAFDSDLPSPLASATGLPLKGELVLVDSPERKSRNGFDTSYTEFAPRFGFGYAISKNTALRGGYGLFWLPSAVSYTPSNPSADPVNQALTPMFATIDGGITPYNKLQNPFPNGIIQPPGRSVDLNPSYYGSTIYSQDPHNPYAYTAEWNLDLQQVLPGGTLLDIAYAAAKGTHLHIVQYQMDQLPDRYLQMGSALLDQVPNPFYGTAGGVGLLAGPTTTRGQLLRPYPQYNSVVYGDYDVGASSYNSLQVKLHKRFSNGQTILAGYTFAKNMNNGAETTTLWLNGSAPIQDFNNLKKEWALSTFDVNQRLVVGDLIDLPFGRGKRFFGTAHGAVNTLVSGWGMDAIWTYQGGFPLYFVDAINATSSYGGNARPNYNAAGCTGGIGRSGSAESRLTQWFNTNCFAHAASFTFGNISRTSPARADGIDNIDMAAHKSTTLHEGLAMDFRLEAFNLFNHPQFGYPGMVFGAPGFGQVGNQVNTPRLLQFAVKLKF